MKNLSRKEEKNKEEDSTRPLCQFMALLKSQYEVQECDTENFAGVAIFTCAGYKKQTGIDAVNGILCILNGTHTHSRARLFYHHHIIIEGKSNGIYMSLITIATQSCLLLIYRSKLNINYKIYIYIYELDCISYLSVGNKMQSEAKSEREKNSTDNNLISKRVERCTQTVWLRNEMSFSETTNGKV